MPDGLTGVYARAAAARRRVGSLGAAISLVIYPARCALPLAQ